MPINWKEIDRVAGRDKALRLYAAHKKFPATMFLPNAAQAEMIKAIGQYTVSPPDNFGKKRVFVMTSGNGSGKTTVSWNILLNIIYPNINKLPPATDVQTGEKINGFFNYPLFNNWPKEWPKTAWYISNPDTIKATIKELQKWAPTGGYEIGKEGKTYASRIRFFDTDWEVFLKTTKQESETFEGAEVGFILPDEPISQEIFTACVSRTRSGGIIVMPATPLGGSAWMHTELVEQATPQSDIVHQTVSCWANCLEDAGEWKIEQLGVHKKGKLSKENILFTLNKYPPYQRPAREFGTFGVLMGSVYKQYKRELHLNYQYEIPRDPDNFMYRMVMDPHQRRSPAVIWLQMDRFGQQRVIYEWPNQHSCPQFGNLPFHQLKDAGEMILRDFVKTFCQIEEDLNIPLSRLERLIDPNFGKQLNNVTGLMVYQEYERLFQEFGRPKGFILDINNDLPSGHEAVRTLLKPMPNGDVVLRIDNKCSNVDYSMRMYSFDEIRGKASEKKEVSEAVLEIGKDFADCLRYSAIVPWTYVEQEPIDYYDKDYDDPDERESVERLQGVGADFV